jgi:hypothetical protein
LAIPVPLNYKSWVEIPRRSVRLKIENRYKTRSEQSDGIQVTHARPQPVHLRAATRPEYKWAIKIHIDSRDLKRFKVLDTGNCTKSRRLNSNLKIDEPNIALQQC